MIPHWALTPKLTNSDIPEFEGNRKLLANYSGTAFDSSVSAFIDARLMYLIANARFAYHGSGLERKRNR